MKNEVFPINNIRAKCTPDERSSLFIRGKFVFSSRRNLGKCSVGRKKISGCLSQSA
jgi:hypothetical protein